MREGVEHPWDVTPREARQIQEQLRNRVVTHDRLAGTQRLAGVDVGFEEGSAVTRAAVVVLDGNTLETVERSLARRPTTFPYVPGLLSFREIPAILQALDGLTIPPPGAALRWSWYRTPAPFRHRRPSRGPHGHPGRGRRQEAPGGRPWAGSRGTGQVVSPRGRW